MSSKKFPNELKDIFKVIIYFLKMFLIFYSYFYEEKSPKSRRIWGMSRAVIFFWRLNVRLKAHHQSFQTHFESHTLETSSEIYRRLYSRYAFDLADSLGSIRNFWDWKFAKIGVLFMFLQILFDWCIVWSRFFYWRRDLRQADLWDTLNIW